MGPSVSLVPGACVGTLFAGLGDIAGEAGGIFAESPFEMPAGGVGSAGFDAGTLCDGFWLLCGSPLSKRLATGIPCVSTAGSFLVTNNVLFSTVGTNISGDFISPAFWFVFRKLESPTEPEFPSEFESPCGSPSEVELPPKFAVSKELESPSGCLSARGFTPSRFIVPPILVVPVLGTSVNAIGTPNLLTGHGGGGVMKVGSGLGCPERIVVV